MALLGPVKDSIFLIEIWQALGGHGSLLSYDDAPGNEFSPKASVYISFRELEPVDRPPS